MLIGNKMFNFEERTYIMGILNVTPDSFSDGGNYNNIEKAIIQAKKMIYDGASIIDIGGESTRPGHQIVTIDEEIKRVVPVIEVLSKETDTPISIDTSKSEVAEAAILAGAVMVNDVWGFKRDKKMAEITSKYNLPCCLMHNRNNNEYISLMCDIINDLYSSIDIALESGVERDNIIIDPGIGFAKNYEQNIEVMKQLDRLQELNLPILLGTSRKSMIGISLDLPVNERVEGTIATTVYGIMKGCNIIRVHDVKENYRAAKMTDIMMGRRLY